MVINIAIPGKIISHQEAESCLPPDNKDPQVTTSSGTPIPRKESPLSINIAEAIPNAILTNTGARALGKACLNIVLIDENPNDFEACTNSNDFILRNSARVNLAIPVHPVTPIIIIITVKLLSTTAVIVIIKINLGIEFKISIPLDINESIGTVISVFNQLFEIILLNNLKRKVDMKMINILIENCITPSVEFCINPSEIIYFRCPKA